jgi:hypothetical protein
MKKLILNILAFSILIFMVLGIYMNNKVEKINASIEAITTTNKIESETTTEIPVVKVKQIKIKYKKTMTVGNKQKVKISKIKPTNATCKKIKIVNKTKKILTVKGKTIKAKTAGIGKIIIKSKDSGFKKIIKIIVKNPIPTCQGVKLQYNASYHITSNPLTPSMGVKYFNGQRETYYSQKVLSGGGLNIPGRHIANDGTIRDKDGYIVVSTNYNFRSKYSTFLTSLGPAKVYDTGCAYGTVDIYCNW